MGCSILSGEDGACFYCSVADVAFGPRMKSEDIAEAFMNWLDKDPRHYSMDELMKLYNKFIGELE